MVVLLCALLMFLDGFDTQAISYIVPALSHDWHLPRKSSAPSSRRRWSA